MQLFMRTMATQNETNWKFHDNCIIFVLFLLRNNEFCDYVTVFMLLTMDLVKNKCGKRNHNINILPHLIQCLHIIESNT